MDAAPAQPAADPRRWWTLVAMSLAMLVVGLDLTVLATALPHLATALGAGTSRLQWFSNAYTLVFAALLLPAGLLSDRLGARPTFLAALVVFGLGSLGCALAGTSAQLIAWRAVLGLGAALLTPVTMSLLTIVFPAHERDRAIGIWMTANAIGMPVGPLLGGWLLDIASWRWIFLLNLPFVTLALVAGAVLVPRTPPNRRVRLDVPGTVLSSAGLAALTYGLVRAGDDGWGSGAAWAWIAAGALLLAAFGAWVARARHPLLEPGLLREPGFLSASVIILLVGGTMVGLLFVLPQYFQSVRGRSAFVSGAMLLPLVAGIALGAKLGPVLTRRGGLRLTIPVGCALMGVGCLVGLHTGLVTPWLEVLAWETLAALGMGLALPAIMSLALDGIAGERSATASATLQAFRQVGATLGVAVLGSVLGAGYRDRLGLPPALPAPARDAAARGIQGALAVAEQAHLPALAGAARGAFVHGMWLTLLVTGAVLLALAVLSWVWLGRVPGAGVGGTRGDTGGGR